MNPSGANQERCRVIDDPKATEILSVFRVCRRRRSTRPAVLLRLERVAVSLGGRST